LYESPEVNIKIIGMCGPIALALPVSSSFKYKFYSVSLKIYFGKLFKQTSLISLFLIGVLNGFLPCGFVYVGLGGALSTGSAFNGMLFMLMFGLGTLPLMFITSIAGNFVDLSVRRKLSKPVPVFAVILALIFILRGMNLGIKYISPSLKPPASSQSTNDSLICH